MLQRIYGTAFPDEDRLNQYLRFLEEARERDHRKLGRELDLFSFSQEVGAGLPLWHPNGAMLRFIIETFSTQEHLKRGYRLFSVPHIARAELYRTSGHLDFYHENMYAPIRIDEQDYYLKPMNCPSQIQIFNSTVRSYRELPFRGFEMGTVYRYERSGVLHGLTRVRGFTQDDAHIFCTPEQLEGEIREVLDFTIFMLETFGFSERAVYLSTRPEHSVGSDEGWELATRALKNTLDDMRVAYAVDPGEGVFYGPKIDIKIKDAIGREWQCSTIQVDFNLPERFDVNYIGPDGKKHRPIMIHRALLGSLERFIGILIEHYGGRFPVWLAPVQMVIINVSEQEAAAAEELKVHFKFLGCRGFLFAHVDDDHLNRSKPYGKTSAVVFNENADEALKRSEEGPVYHDRTMLFAVRPDVIHVESLRQVEINLDGAALPFPADSVFYLDVYFRSVEDALARINGIGDAHIIKRILQRPRRQFPSLVGADRMFRPGGKVHRPLAEAEGLEHEYREIEDLAYLALKLFGGAEDVRVILSESPHSGQAVENT